MILATIVFFFSILLFLASLGFFPLHHFTRNILFSWGLAQTRGVLGDLKNAFWDFEIWEAFFRSPKTPPRYQNLKTPASNFRLHGKGKQWSHIPILTFVPDVALIPQPCSIHCLAQRPCLHTFMIYHWLFCMNRQDWLILSLHFYFAAIKDYETAAKHSENDHQIKEGLEKAQRLLKQSQRRDYYKILGVKRWALTTGQFKNLMGFSFRGFWVEVFFLSCIMVAIPICGF